MAIKNKDPNFETLENHISLALATQGGSVSVRKTVDSFGTRVMKRETT